jgi:hypothetical protein
VALVYSQNWSDGLGSVMPWSAVASYHSNSWNGADAADTVYPELAWAAYSTIDIGTGPAGENVLVSTGVSDASNAGVVLGGLGSLTSPNGTTGWWNADSGTVRFDVEFAADFYADCFYFPLFALDYPGLSIGVAEQFMLAVNKATGSLPNGNYNFHLTGPALWDSGSKTDLDRYSNGGSFNTPLFNQTGAGGLLTVNGWRTIEMRWQCGTVTGDFASVASDGWIEIRWGAQGAAWSAMTELFNETGLDLFTNEGYQQDQDGSAPFTQVYGVQNNRLRSVWLGFFGLAPTTNLEIYDGETSEDLLVVTQTYIDVLSDEDFEPGGTSEPTSPTSSTDAYTQCTGGGTVVAGTNPADGASLETSTAPFVYVVMTTGGTSYHWAGDALNVGTRKEPRVLDAGRHTRSLTDADGNFETPAVTLRLSDNDRFLRGLMDTGTLMNQPVDIYIADRATIEAGGTPRRVTRGKVRKYKPEKNLEFTITVEDALTLATSAFAQERLIPTVQVGSSLGATDPESRKFDAPVPHGFGKLSDAEDDAPEGVVEFPYVGDVVVTGQEALGALRVFMGPVGVAAQIQVVYHADMGSGDPPTQRAAAPVSAYGSYLFVPGKTGWIGDGAKYWTTGGRRHTVLFGLPGHPAVELAKEGTIPLVVNLCGYETTGDGTGATIDSPARQLALLLNNYVFQDATGNWLAQASITGGGYSVLDTTSFEDVHDKCEELGYASAGLVGKDRQLRLRDVIARFCRSFGFDLGINRHGQVMLAMFDRGNAYADAPVFSDLRDILGSLEVDANTDTFENVIRYVHTPALRTALPDLTPTTGARLPKDPAAEGWLSGTQSLSDAASIAAIGEERESDILELDFVRDADVAYVVANERLKLRRRPRPDVTFTVTVARGLDVELGDVIKVTHFEGVSATGWTERRVQVRRIVIDLQQLTVQLTCRDVHDLLPDVFEEGSDSGGVGLTEAAFVDPLPAGNVESVAVGVSEVTSIVVVGSTAEVSATDSLAVQAAEATDLVTTADGLVLLSAVDSVTVATEEVVQNTTTLGATDSAGVSVSDSD